MELQCTKLLKGGFLLFTLLIVSVVTAQTKVTSVFDYLTKEEGAKLALEMDFTTLLAMRKTNDYFPATLTDGEGTAFKTEVRARGRYRRKTCEMPPLKIKFSKKQLTKMGLDTLNEVRLVVPCVENEQGQELIVREYLAYRMFEALSPASVRARLVRVQLHDTQIDKRHELTCLLVEHDEEVAKRLGGSMVETFGVKSDSLLVNQAALLVMFQYMIGNTDWDISLQRNVWVLRTQNGKMIALPYDFDFSGLVSAPYATPTSESGLRTVRDRFLMSSGLSAESLRRATTILKASKTELLNAGHSKHLSPAAQEDVSNYLESFFHILEQHATTPVTWHAPMSE